MVRSSTSPPLDSLVDLACRDGVDIRPTLLRVLTDLYVQKPAHSAGEEIQYVELALGLIGTVDPGTRAAVAATLSAYPAAPAAILARLSDVILPAALPAPPAPPMRTARPAAGDDLTALFFAASAEERRLILTNLDIASSAPARAPAAASEETIRRLENAALQRNVAEFSRLLERALGVGRKLAERIARDRLGEPVVVAARAIGMKAAVLQRVLLFLDSAIGQSVTRVFELARLFDELTPAAAAHMVAIWRQSNERAQSHHAPLHWDDERRDARSLSTPARYRSDRGRVTQPSRAKTGGK